MKKNISTAALSLAVLLCGGAGTRAWAQPASDQSQQHPARGRAMARETRETATVTAVDRNNRMVTLRDDTTGEQRRVSVPPEIKQFDRLKPGDHIDIDYYESMVVSMMPPGAKPSISHSQTGASEARGGMVGRETTVSAQVMRVDTAGNTVTLKGPSGETRTLDVTDPAMQRRLPTIKPGQVVQFTYTEETAASIRPR
jgi:hypothetical protein